MIKRVTSLMRGQVLLLVALTAIVLYGLQASSLFLSGYNLSGAALDIAPEAFMVLPMTLIIIVGEIDLSVASILGLSSALFGRLIEAGLPAGIVCALALIAGAAAGAFNGVIVLRMRVPSLVVTLGSLGLFRGLAYVILGGTSVTNFPSWFTTIGYGYVPTTLIPWSSVIFVVVLIPFALTLHGHRWGREMVAIGRDPNAARYAGLRVDRVKFVLFILSGLVAAFAGLMYAAQFASARADNGLGLELNVITIVLLGGVSIFGGVGTIAGVVLSLVSVSLLLNILTLKNVSGDGQSVAIGAILIIAVVASNAEARESVRSWISRKRRSRHLTAKSQLVESAGLPPRTNSK